MHWLILAQWDEKSPPDSLQRTFRRKQSNSADSNLSPGNVIFESSRGLLAKTSMSLLDFIWVWMYGTFAMVLQVWGRQDPTSWSSTITWVKQIFKTLSVTGGKMRQKEREIFFVCVQSSMPKRLINQNKVVLDNIFLYWFRQKGRELEINSHEKMYFKICIQPRENTILRYELRTQWLIFSGKKNAVTFTSLAYNKDL